MMELSQFSNDQLNSMLRNMEHTDFITYRKANWLKPTHTALIQQYGKEYNNELWMILTFTARCVRYDTNGFRLSLNRNHYSKSKTITTKTISCKRTRELVSMMEDDGYIVFLKGFYHSEDRYARSCVLINKKLSIMLDKKKSNKFAMSRDDLLDNIEFVDSEKSTTTKFKNSLGKMIKKKTLVFKETKGKAFSGLKIKRLELKNYNLLIEENNIRIDNKAANCIIYKRRFEDDMSKFGRYYDCGMLQTSKSELRKTITINNNPTCEIDFKNIQPRILATESGIKYCDGFDPYSVGIKFENKTTAETRKLVKSLFFPILFTNKRSDAKRAITTKLKTMNIETDFDSEFIIKAIENHNKEISHLFYNKSNAARLQNIDSKIAEYIINHFTNKGIVCLCWHDSFVVESKYKEELESLMFIAWKHILGNTDNCGVDVEYNNSVIIVNCEEKENVQFVNFESKKFIEFRYKKARN